MKTCQTSPESPAPKPEQHWPLPDVACSLPNRPSQRLLSVDIGRATVNSQIKIQPAAAKVWCGTVFGSRPDPPNLSRLPDRPGGSAR